MPGTCICCLSRVRMRYWLARVVLRDCQTDDELRIDLLEAGSRQYAEKKKSFYDYAIHATN